MIVYVDLFFMINLIYDFLTLNALNIVLKRNIKTKRLLFASFVGTITSFSMFIPIFNNTFILIILSIIMLILSFGYKDIIYLKNNIIYYYMISVIFGGFIYLIDLKTNHYFSYKDRYNGRILSSFIGIIVLAIIIYFLYLKTIKNSSLKLSNYFSVKLSVNDKIHFLNGFYDTGNLIKDPYKGRAVILVNHEMIKSDIKNKSPILVPCNMINNLVILKCYKPNLLVINDKVINNCLIGLWENNFNDGINAIISGYMGDKIR